MPTAAERQALAFLAGVALLGGGARLWVQHYGAVDAASRRSSVAAAESVERQLSAVDSAKSARRGKKRPMKSATSPARPAGAQRSVSLADESETEAVIDVDVATAEELERLPRVGPALAARIVANRDSLGPFGSLDALGQVRGIGPALLKILEVRVSFSARPRALPGGNPVRKHPVRRSW